MDGFLYQYSVGGAVFALGLALAAKQGYGALGPSVSEFVVVPRWLALLCRRSRVSAVRHHG